MAKILEIMDSQIHNSMEYLKTLPEDIIKSIEAGKGFLVPVIEKDNVKDKLKFLIGLNPNSIDLININSINRIFISHLDDYYSSTQIKEFKEQLASFINSEKTKNISNEITHSVHVDVFFKSPIADLDEAVFGIILNQKLNWASLDLKILESILVKLYHLNDVIDAFITDKYNKTKS